MEEQQFPKDENLRLILSTDQEQWLNQRIRDWRRFAWGMAIVLVVSSAWVTAAAMGAFRVSMSRNVFRSLAALWMNRHNVIKLRPLACSHAHHRSPFRRKRGQIGKKSGAW